MATRKRSQYSPGELDVILSLIPTKTNIVRLSELLNRTPEAIEIVYKIAYGSGRLGKGIQKEKIIAEKNRVGIVIGPKTTRQ